MDNEQHKQSDASGGGGSFRPGRGAVRIALIYAAVAGMWILVSDHLLHWVPDAVLFSKVKGLFFVSATAAMLYGLVRRQSSALERSEAQLRATVARLTEVDKRKDEFLALLSHELRNPLTPIVNSVTLLGRNASLDEGARRKVAIIGRQAAHLARLVNDLLDHNRVSSGAICFQQERLDLSALLKRTLEDHQGTLAGRSIVSRLPEGELPVLGDRDRLVQAIGNLLSNAAKFTSDGGSVQVTLEARGAEALLEVADDGKGIDAETLGRMFEPFNQADRALARTRGGLGLGLALVKEIVRHHGGRVGAHSDGPGKGARFTLALPLDPVRGAPGASASPGPETAAERLRVLVIEDNRDCAESLGESLTMRGHEVTVALNGRDGLTLAKEVRPDVILSDIGLPDIDGYSLAFRFREDPRLARALLVALTGYALPEDEQRARDAGFDSHFAKPVDLDRLEEYLEGETRRRRGGRGA